MAAGQESSGSTLAWVFYYLSNNPDIQEALRQEIADTRTRAGADTHFSIQDYDGMSMLNMVIKVRSLRKITSTA